MALADQWTLVVKICRAGERVRFKMTLQRPEEPPFSDGRLWTEATLRKNGKKTERF